MEDLVILVLLGVLTGLYLIHRTVYGSIYEKAQILSFLVSQPSFQSFQALDLPTPPPSPSPPPPLSSTSPLISRALGRGVELLLHDFVDPWYDRLSTSPDFPNDVRHLFDRSFNSIAHRCHHIDWTAFIVRNVLNNVNFLLKVYRLSERALRKGNPFYKAADPAGKHQMLRAELTRMYRLHPGVSDPEGYLRMLSTALLSRLLPHRDFRCEGMRDLLREMMLNQCLKVGMSFVEPYWMNVSLINVLKKQKEMAEKSGEGQREGQGQLGMGGTGEGGKGGKKKKERRHPPHYIEGIDDSPDRPTDLSLTSHSASSTLPLPLAAPHAFPPLSSSLPKSSSFLQLAADSAEGTASAPSSPYPLQPHSRDGSEADEDTYHHRPDTDDHSDEPGEWPIEAKDDGDDRKDPTDPSPDVSSKVDLPSESALDKENRLNQKMAQWNNEREKRREQEKHTLASTHSLGEATEMKTGATFPAGLPPPHKPHPSAPFTPVSLPPKSKRPTSSTKGFLTLPPAFMPNFTSVPFTAITSNWEVSIIGAGHKFDPKPYVAYQLRVKNGSTQGVLEWIMIKRYAQFEELHGRLKRGMGGTFTAMLPKKHFFGNLDAEFIRQRKKELDKYLSQLLWNKRVLDSEELRFFLIPNERDFKDLQKQGEKGNMNVMTPQPGGGGGREPSLPSTSAGSTPNSPFISSHPATVRARSATEESSHSSAGRDPKPLSSSNDLSPLPPTSATTDLSASGVLLPLSSPSLTSSITSSGGSSGARSESSSAASTPGFSSQAAPFASPPSTPRNPVSAPPPNAAVPISFAASVSHVLPPPTAAPTLPVQARPPSAPGPPMTPPRITGTPPSQPRTRRASRSTPSSHPPPTSSSHRLTRSQYEKLQFEKEISENLYILVDEMFDLSSRSFVRRQAAWMTKQIVKLTANNLINAWLKEAIGQATSEKAVTAQIEWMTDLMWPGGVWKGSSPGVGEGQKAETKAKAREMLMASIPSSLKTLLGAHHTERAMDRFFHFLQMEPLMQHFAFSVLDMLTLTLYPELKSLIKVTPTPQHRTQAHAYAYTRTLLPYPDVAPLCALYSLSADEVRGMGLEWRSVRGFVTADGFVISLCNTASLTHSPPYTMCYCSQDTLPLNQGATLT